MPETKRKNERLVALFLLGLFALNYPLISLFSKVRLYYSIPVLYLYIFLCWVLFILGVALIMELPASPLYPMQLPKRRTPE